jgi:hypothetical protein
MINLAGVDLTYAVMQNFGLTMLMLALVLFIVEWLIQKIRGRNNNYEILYHWIALLPLGFTALYAFVLHAFLPALAAGTIGWPVSPFQYEVAIANLSIGIIAICSTRQTYSFRLATVIASTIWLWGNAIGHMYQMYLNNNFSVGNAGTWFWLDVFIPILLILCLRRLRYPIVAE